MWSPQKELDRLICWHYVYVECEKPCESLSHRSTFLFYFAYIRFIVLLVQKKCGFSRNITTDQVSSRFPRQTSADLKFLVSRRSCLTRPRVCVIFYFDVGLMLLIISFFFLLSFLVLVSSDEANRWRGQIINVHSFTLECHITIFDCVQQLAVNALVSDLFWVCVRDLCLLIEHFVLLICWCKCD